MVALAVNINVEHFLVRRLWASLYIARALA
jgi:hypothetical protein